MKSTSHGTSSCAHQVREEEDRALQHAHQHEVAPVVVAGDLCRQLAHPALELLAPGQGSPRSRRRRCTLSQCMRHGSGRAPRTRPGPAALAEASKRRPPRSQTARSPDPTCSCPRPVSAATLRRRRPRPAPGRCAASASRWTTSRDERRRQLAQARERDLAAPSSTSSTRASRTAASSRRRSASASTFAPPPGWTSRRAGTRSWRTRAARVGGGIVGRVLAPGQAPLRGSRPPVCSRVNPSSGRITPPLARAHPQQRSPARRGGQPVEDRLDLVGRGVPGRDVGAAPRAASSRAAR